MRIKKIVSFLALFLLLATAVYAEKQSDIDLQINSFEKAYYELKDNWIFFEGHKRVLNLVMVGLSYLTEKLEIQNVPSPILGDNEDENLKIVKEYLRLLMTARPEGADRLSAMAIRSLVLTDYFAWLESEEEHKQRTQKSLGNYEGDGIDATFQDNQVIVLSTIQNSPAEKAGFQTGDIILKINNISFEGIIDKQDLDNRYKKFHPEEFSLGKEVVYEILRESRKLILKTKIIKIGEEEWAKKRYWRYFYKTVWLGNWRTVY